MSDLWRQYIVKTSLNDKIFDKYLKNLINDLQNVLDRNKVSSEVHIILKKK